MGELAWPHSACPPAGRCRRGRRRPSARAPAVEVVGGQHADRAEEDDHALAVGRGRGVRLARLQVPAHGRRRLTHLALPDDRAASFVSSAKSRNECSERSSTECRRRRGRCGTVSSPVALTAVVTKMRSPQTIGLESASPGIGVLKRTFVARRDVPGAARPGRRRRRTPAAPRNWGHGRAGSRAAARRERAPPPAWAAPGRR